MLNLPGEKPVARPTETNVGAAAVGAGVGALFGPVGAGMGGLVGGIMGTNKLPLDQAVGKDLASRGLGMGSFQRLSRSRARLLFTDASGGYWTIEVQTESAPTLEQEVVEDGLYDETIRRLNEWQKSRAGSP